MPPLQLSQRPDAAIMLGCLLAGLAVSEASGADTPATSFDLPGDTYREKAMVFSRDLHWLAAWRLPDQVEVWDVAKRAKAAGWAVGPAGPWSFLPGGHRRPMAFLEDGRRIVVANATNVAVYDFLSGKLDQVLEDSALGAGQISVSPDGRCVVGVITNGEFAFWSLPDGKRRTDLPTKRAPWERRGSPFNYSAMALRTPPTSMSPETDWAFSPDGRAFAIGRLFNVDLWDLERGQWLSRYSGMEVPDFRIGGPTFGGAMTVAFLSASNLAVVCGGALAVLSVGTHMTALAVTNPASPSQERLDIRGLGVSANGTRLAVAGMRMGARASMGDPGAGPVFDVPQQGEIQVWDVTPLRRRMTIKGSDEEKFGFVAVDVAGKRVAAVTTGVHYTSRMNNSQQQQVERNPPGPYRVGVWEVP